MADWSIGTVELAGYEAPDGEMEFGAKALWVYHNPIGYNGRLRQFHGIDANEHEWHLYCGEITKQALKALVGPTAVVVVAPRPDFEEGQLCTIESVSALWSKQVPGQWTSAQVTDNLGTHPSGDKFGWYDVTIKFVGGAES